MSLVNPNMHIRFNRKEKSDFSLGLKLKLIFHSFKRVEL